MRRCGFCLGPLPPKPAGQPAPATYCCPSHRTLPYLARHREPLGAAFFANVANWEDCSPLQMLREAGVRVALWPR